MAFSFSEERLPPELSLGCSGGPIWQTQVTVLDSGFEQRNSVWAEDKGEWDLGYANRDPEEADTLFQFFQARRGKLQGFRFRDWRDFQAINEPFGVGDVTTTVFLLRRTYTSGGDTSEKIIPKPVAETVSIFLDDAAQTEGTDYTIDDTTGAVTFASPPGADAVLTWTGEYDKPVRFDTDKLTMTWVTGTITTFGHLPVVEIRIP